jgi:hypothetical protein
MNRAVSSQSPRCVVDTVVLRYFLFADRVDVLLELVGAPIVVPRIIFDPDDAEAPAAAKSELTASVAHQRKLATDPTRDPDEQALADLRAERLSRVGEMFDNGDLVVFDMTEEERRMMAQLTSPSGCKAFGIKFPLQAGEAACIAIAVHRRLTIATDDNDALKALGTIPNAPDYERIRKLLMRATDQGLVSGTEAQAIHAEMRQHGFWDSPL